MGFMRYIVGASAAPSLPAALCTLMTFWGFLPIFSSGASFSPGNILVLYINGNTSSATPVTLREYTSAGTLVQDISVSGNCTASGSASSEGKLLASFDGTRVSWGCYFCPEGFTSIAAVRSAMHLVCKPT